MAATITDIAKLAGVSHGTVSRVLNNAPIRVSSKKRQEILDAAEQLNYVPNQSAKSLRRGRHHVISMIAYDITDAFAIECMSSMEKVIADSPYRINWTSCAPLENNEKAPTELLYTAAQSSDGIIFIAANGFLKDAEINRFWAGSHTPIVTVIREVAGGLISSVTINEEYGASILMDHLFDLGHSQIAFCTSSKENDSANRRHGVYFEKMIEKGCSINPDWQVQVDGTAESGYRAGLALIEQGDLPTAIIAYNDLTSLGLIKAFYEKEINVPQEINIASFDNIRMAQFVTPALTTVATDFDELMGMAFKEIGNKINYKKQLGDTIQQIVSEPKLIVRQSTSHTSTMKGATS